MTAVVPVAGFISQRITDPAATHAPAARDVNVGYKWHHSKYGPAGEDISRDKTGAMPGEGLVLVAGEDLDKEFKGARDATLPMLNYQNAETLAKLVQIVTRGEPEGTWKLLDLCPIHGTTTVAFARSQAFKEVEWCSAQFDPLCPYADQETPVRMEPTASDNGKVRTKAFWPYLAALHGEIVADSIISGRAYVKAYPDLVTKLAGGRKMKPLQGDALERRARSLKEVDRVTPNNRRMEYRRMWEDAHAEADLRTRIRFIVEAIFTRMYTNRQIVSTILWLLDLAAAQAKLPHGYTAAKNEQSRAAVNRALDTAGVKHTTEANWSVKNSTLTDLGTHLAVNVTMDWDVHSEHARLKLRYLQHCARKFAEDDYRIHRNAQMLSFTLPRAFRTVKVDFSRRCSLSNYLFHHMRYFDVNGTDGDFTENVKLFHHWCSEKRFTESLHASFLPPGRSHPTFYPESALPGDLQRIRTQYDDIRTHWVFWVDQGPLRFVVVYRPTKYNWRWQVVPPLLFDVITHAKSVPAIDPLASTKFVKAEKSQVNDVSEIGKRDPSHTRLLMVILERVFGSMADAKKTDDNELRETKGVVAALRDAFFFAYSKVPGKDGQHAADVLRVQIEELQKLYEGYTAKGDKDAVLAPQYANTARRLIENVLRYRSVIAMARPGAAVQARKTKRAEERNTSTHGGFWRVDESAGRDRMRLVPNALYKFKARPRAIDTSALSLDLPDGALALPRGPVAPDEARRMTGIYRRYIYHQRMMKKDDTASTLIDAVRYDENRAVLSYGNARRLAMICAEALEPMFLDDTRALQMEVNKSWGFPAVLSGESKLAQKAPPLTLRPLWVVYQSGYGSATLALYEAGFRVAEVSHIREFDAAAVDAKRPPPPPPMFAIGRTEAHAVPTGKLALVRMSILTSETRASVTAEREYPGPFTLASPDHIASLFLAIPESPDFKRLLHASSSSFFLCHVRISNYDWMVEGQTPEFNVDDSWMLTQVVEYVSLRGIRKVIIVPVPVASRGACNPFRNPVAVPDGIPPKCIRVHMHSFDLLFIFTGLSSDADVGPIRDRLQTACAHVLGL